MTRLAQNDVKVFMLKDPKKFLNSLPNRPGVYEMYDAKAQVLYVGKAKNLKKRLQNYFRSAQDSKTNALMAKIVDIKIIVTSNENDAWLLEGNLIKLKKPHYNILFKDDKSFPYLVLSRHEFPRLSIYRGVVNKAQGNYFGPYPDASAVRFIFNLVQKVFQLRVCKDVFMNNRSRPCMLYQINLCSAPCKRCIDKKGYAVQVDLVERFLSGKNDYVVRKLTELMDIASVRLDYEQAADYRDQITNIRKIQKDQAISKSGGSCDVVALVAKEGVIVINILFVRNGLVVGNKNYFPEVHAIVEPLEEILIDFIRDHYFARKDGAMVPETVLFDILDSRQRSSMKALEDRHSGMTGSIQNLSQLFYKKFGRKIKISSHVRGAQKQLKIMARENAFNALKTRVQSTVSYDDSLLDLQKSLSLSNLPKHIECFDVSHTMGEEIVASCVVFKEGGFSNKDYRCFNIRTTRKGDDYQALRETLLRRYSTLSFLPDLIIIDGGIGQLNVAKAVLEDLNIKDVTLLAIAKGKDRKPGLETIYVAGEKPPLPLSPKTKVFRLIQQIRDEAHRFAVSSHRKRMRKNRSRSELENIVGVGKLKRTFLLKYFGGLQELRAAGIDDLAKVKGIGNLLAKRIYEHLHA